MQLVFAGLLAISAVAAVEPSKFKASELVRKAVADNPAVQSAKLGWDLAQIEKKNRFYSYFPMFAFQTAGGLNPRSGGGLALNTVTIPQLPNDPWTSQYSFTATDTLYGPKNNYWYYKEGDLAERFAELAYRLQRDQTSLSLVQKICDVIDTSYQVEINREILKWVKVEYAIIQSSYKQGLKSYSDFLRFKGRVLNQELAVKNLETTREKGLVDVAVFINMSEGVGEIEDDLLGLDTQMESQARPGDLIADQLLKYQKDLTETRVRVTKASVPWELDFNLSAGYGQYEYLRGSPWLQEQGPWESAALLNFKLQLFDWGQSSRAIQTTRLQQQQLELKQEALKTTAYGRINQLREDIENSEGQLPTLNELVRVNDESLKQQTINYRNGKSTFLDYIDALTGEGQARQTLHGTQLQLKKLRAEVLALKGSLYENIAK